MDKTQFTITKGIVEVYKVRHPSGMYWADITIDAVGKTGRIQIASDFGDWQNYWGACGNSFKEFIAGLDVLYAARNFGADKYFDSEGTLNVFRQCINDSLHSCSIEQEFADRLFGEVNTLANISQEPEFVHELRQMDGIIRFFLGAPPICRTITPKFKEFWEKIWPVFIQQLKHESEYCADCNLPYSADYKIIGPFHRPTEEDLRSPVFNAIFQAIKGWKDIKVPDRYTGTLHADGKHAKLIYDAIIQVPPTAEEVLKFREALNAAKEGGE